MKESRQLHFIYYFALYARRSILEGSIAKVVNCRPGRLGHGHLEMASTAVHPLQKDAMEKPSNKPIEWTG